VQDMDGKCLSYIMRIELDKFHKYVITYTKVTVCTGTGSVTFIHIYM
jgi:hypothetical protein